MKSLPRVVEAEWLDTLPAHDPRALRSRGDLRRLNRIMNHASLIGRALRDHWPAEPGSAAPVKIAELGAGDGSLLLRVARLHDTGARPAMLQLIDRQPAVTSATMQRLTAAGWPAQAVIADVHDWLSRPASNVDIMVCNLFLHHFEARELAELLRAIARRTRVFIACEPARTRRALYGSRLLGLIGCNDVTRHDAVLSVMAGFAARDLSALWPARAGWRLDERPAGLFSHVLIATRIPTS